MDGIASENSSRPHKRLLLVRHGQVKGNLDRGAYWKGDSSMSLTDVGQQQVADLTKFLMSFYINEDNPPKLVTSPHERASQTSGIVKESLSLIFNDKSILFAKEILLIEKFFAATNAPKNWKNLWGRLTRSKIADHLFGIDCFQAKNSQGESTADVYVRVRQYVEGALQKDWDNDVHDHLIVSHGGTMKSLLVVLCDLPVEAHSKLPAIHNCDAIMLEGNDSGGWDVEKIYDGEGKEFDLDILKGLRPVTIDDLPKAPAHIRKQIEEHARTLRL